jgi:hypothetical protein
MRCVAFFVAVYFLSGIRFETQLHSSCCSAGHRASLPLPARKQPVSALSCRPGMSSSKLGRTKNFPSLLHCVFPSCELLAGVRPGRAAGRISDRPTPSPKPRREQNKIKKSRQPPAQAEMQLETGSCGARVHSMTTSRHVTRPQCRQMLSNLPHKLYSLAFGVWLALHKQRRI